MSKNIHTQEFQTINNAYNSIFKVNKLTIGVMSPIESYAYNPIPKMNNDIEKIQMIEELGFSAVWLRDIPFNVPSFGDLGQIYDPFVYLSFLAARTKKIALGVSSIILPLRHPAHIAKSASSIDVLSNGRLILGVASGDRPEEYPALNLPFHDRGDRFRESFEYIRNMWEKTPIFENIYGSPNYGLDMLPKPKSGKFPMLVTGGSQQSPQWGAANGEGLITYPRDPLLQGKIVERYRNTIDSLKLPNKPVSQSLYIDLVDDPNIRPQNIHLGYRLNIEQLLKHLIALEKVGVNHVTLNLRFNNANIEETLKKIAKEVLPRFTPKQ